MRLDDDEELVSFDVVSLFTSIPVTYALEIVRERLEKDTTLIERTMLTPTDVVDLLNFCLSSTEFQFRGCFYKQIHGTAK